jgi:hypothetical protein
VVVPVPRKRKSNLRTAGLVAGSLVVVAVVALVLANLAGSGNSGGNEKPKHVANNIGLVLKIGKVNVQSAGPPPRVKSSVKQAVLDASQTYVDDAVLAPLDKGKLDPAYAKIFDLGVRNSATGSDRATLTEVRTGKVKAPKATATTVSLDAMGDQTGKLVLVAATFGVDVNATGSGGPVKIQRFAELTFAPEGNRWLVTAYRVGVTRKLPASTTSAHVRAGSEEIS